MSRLPRVAVVGVGSVGGIVAGALESAGRSVVTCVARGRALQVLRRDGLRVRTFEGADHHFDFDRGQRVVDATAAPADAHHHHHHQDFVIVATKAHQLAGALDAVGPLVGPGTTVVPAVNGLPWWFHRLSCTDPGGRLSREIDVSQVLGCVGMISGGVRGDYERWESHWPSARNTLTLGEPMAPAASPSSSPAETLSPRAAALAALFEGGDVHVGVEIVPDIRSRVFDKLLINASLNPVGALGGADCGETCEPGSASARLVRTLVEEATAVAAALEAPVALTHTADSVLAYYEGQYGLRTSMLQDLAAGRQTEVDHIVRSLVELGQAHGVATPSLSAVADLVDTRERTAT